MLARLLLVLLISTGSLSANDVFERKTPEEAGYSVEKLVLLRNALEEKGSSSMLLLHDGKIFFEYGDIHHKHLVHSIRKSLLNSLVGIAVADGKIDINRTLAELNVQDYPTSLNEIEQSATIDMLLKSRSGVYLPATAESKNMMRTKPERGAYKPGEFHYYNNWDFNAMGALYEQLAGEKIFTAFQKKIAQPLGMTSFKGKVQTIKLPDEEDIAETTDAVYQYELGKTKFPAYHFRMSSHDLALYGQLYLNRGVWQGEQIIPSSWIDYSTQPYSITNKQYGISYGALWRVLVPDNPEDRPSFYHTGIGRHMLGIYPKHNLVMVHRVDTEQDYRFKSDDLYTIIRLMHQARL